MEIDLTRRHFIGAAAAGAAAFMLPASTTNIRTGELVKNRKINIACIGCGGKGAVDIAGVSTENIVGLCDVDFRRAAGTFAKHPEAQIFRDYREMLTALDDRIDAVVVSTPDHTHFPAAMMAMAMGKHVYVQKPISHTVAEARILTEQARRHKVITQMGNQGHSGEGTRLVKEWIDAGVIGEVREVHLFTNRPVWPQNIPAPKGEPLAPDSVDWNRWLGVAPWRPFDKSLLPFNWRGWWDYGTGAIGDMGCHGMDAAFWALELGAPSRVSAHVEGGSALSCPAGEVITYEFPARGSRPPVLVKWFDGTCRPPRPRALDASLPMPTCGQIYYGSKGVLLDGTDCCDNPHLIPRSANHVFKRPPKTLPRVTNGHYQNWLDGIRGRVEAPCSNFDHAGPLTELAMLGAVAVRARGTFNWNAATLTCDNPVAQRYVDKTYRVF